MLYWTPSTHDMLTLYPWNIKPPIHDILNSLSMVSWPHGISNRLSMVYRTLYSWYFDHLPMVYEAPYPWHIKPPTHIILTPLHMVYQSLYPWYVYPLRTKRWPLTYGILNSFSWYIESTIHGISNPLPMVFWPSHYPWNIESLIHGTFFNPLSVAFRNLGHSILSPYQWNINPLSIIYKTPYPWYIEQLTHSNLTPLHMVYQTLYSWCFDSQYPWYIEPLSMV